LEKMGKTVAMMERFEDNTMILIRIWVLQAILERKHRKTGFGRRIWVNTCFMDALYEM